GTRAVLQTPAHLQICKELVGAGNRRKDLLVGGTLLQRGHGAVEAAVVGRAPEDIAVEALNDVLAALQAAENGRGDLARGRPPRQRRTEPRLAAGIDPAVEGVLVEGRQEAVVGAAAAGLEVFRRPGDSRFHLLDRVAGPQEIDPAADARLFSGAVQELLIRLLHHVGQILR